MNGSGRVTIELRVTLDRAHRHMHTETPPRLMKGAYNVSNDTKAPRSATEANRTARRRTSSQFFKKSSDVKRMETIVRFRDGAQFD